MRSRCRIRDNKQKQLVRIGEKNEKKNPDSADYDRIGGFHNVLYSPQELKLNHQVERFPHMHISIINQFILLSLPSLRSPMHKALLACSVYHFTSSRTKTNVQRAERRTL